MSPEERIKLRDSITSSLERECVIKKIKNGRWALCKRKATLEDILQDYPEIEKQYKLYVSEFRSEREAYFCLIHDDDSSNHLCPVCGKVCQFYIKNKTECMYRKTCSSECQQKMIHTQEAQEKFTKTCEERYGVSYPSQSSEIQEKIKQSNLERWGVECTLNSPEVQDKIKETMVKRYGVEHPMHSEEIKRKFRETSIERYGVESPSQSEVVRKKRTETNLERWGVECTLNNPEVQEKGRQTILERYGVKNIFESQEIQEQIRQTMLDKYAVPNSMMIPEVREKARETMMKRYGVPNSMMIPEVRKKASRSVHEFFEKRRAPVSDKEFLEIMMSFENSENKISRESVWIDNEKLSFFIRKLCERRGRKLFLGEIASSFNIKSSQNVQKRMDKLDLLECFEIKQYVLEIMMREFLDKNSVQYTLHDHKTISPYEIDFLIGDFGIEVNDVKTHSVKRKGETYHRDKTALAEKQGVQLIHIWEWEMTVPRLWERTSKWILSTISNTKERIFARKCKMCTVEAEEEKEFLETYHLQGYRKSEICLGLYCNNELIQLMSFCKSRFNPNYEWELLRLCTKFGTIVIGGPEKLLNSFYQENKPQSVISYCDLSKFIGNVYTQMDFQLLRVNSPRAIWYNDITMKRFSQQSLAKHGADQLIGTNFGPGTSNEQIAEMCGYTRMYDCGQAVYGKIFRERG